MRAEARFADTLRGEPGDFSAARPLYHLAADLGFDPPRADTLGEWFGHSSVSMPT